MRDSRTGDFGSYWSGWLVQVWLKDNACFVGLGTSKLEAKTWQSVVRVIYSSRAEKLRAWTDVEP